MDVRVNMEHAPNKQVVDSCTSGVSKMCSLVNKTKLSGTTALSAHTSSLSYGWL